MTEVEALYESLLKQAQLAYRRGTVQLRDALLETGKLLHEFVLAYLRQGDEMSEAARLRAGFTRDRAIQLAMAALDTSSGNVCRFISTAIAVQLLAKQGDVGKLSWSAVNLFTRFVKRRSSKHPGRNGGISTEVEAWEVKQPFEPRAKALFNKAVVDGMTYEQIRVAALKLYQPSKAAPKANAGRRRQNDGEQSALYVLQACAKVALPKDVAEMCMGLVTEAEDPAATAACLQGLLTKFLSRKQATA